MADRFVMSHIRRLPMFSALPEAYLELLSEHVQVARYEAGEVIFYQGQPAQGMYLLVTGQAALLQQTANGVQQLGMISANQYLNEVVLLRESVESATFRTVEPSIVLLLTRAAFLTLLSQHPDLRNHLQLQPALQALLPPPAPVSPVAPAPQNTQTMPIYQQPAPQHTTQARITPSTGGGHPSQFQPMQVSPAPSAPVINTPLAPAPTTNLNPTPQFQGQRRDERVLLQTRRHWWAYVQRVWWALIMAAVLFGVSALVPSVEVRVLLLIVNIVLPIAYIAYYYFDWRVDQLIVTDQRVVHIDHTLITFQLELNEVPLQSIQAVNTDIPVYDVFARFMQYGDVVIKTTGSAGTIKLSLIPQSEKVQNLIFEQINAHKKGNIRSTQDIIRADIDRMFGAGGGDDQDLQAMPTFVYRRPGFLQMRYINEAGDTVYRKHWTVWFRHIFVPLLILLGAAAGLVAWLAIPAVNALGIIVLPIVGVAVAIGGVWFYWADWDWRNDLYIISNDTITLVHRRPLWMQNDDDRVLINRIDNVGIEIRGIGQTLFNYGMVRISLIGDTTTKIFKNVPEPRAIQDEISTRQTRARQAAEEEEEQRRREEIANYIAAYDASRRGHVPQSPLGGGSLPENRPDPRPPNVPRIRRN